MKKTNTIVKDIFKFVKAIAMLFGVFYVGMMCTLGNLTPTLSQIKYCLIATGQEYCSMFYHIIDGDFDIIGMSEEEKHVPAVIGDIVREQFNVLPENIREKFIKDGNRILVANRVWEVDTSVLGDNFTKEYGDTITAAGTYSASEDLIKLSSKSVSKGVLYHEMGHYVDDVLSVTRGNERYTTLFVNCLKEEAKFIETFEYEEDYVQTSDGEFFAEMFYVYMSYPEELREECPAIYTAMNFFCKDFPEI